MYVGEIVKKNAYLIIFCFEDKANENPYNFSEM